MLFLKLLTIPLKWDPSHSYSCINSGVAYFWKIWYFDPLENIYKWLKYEIMDNYFSTTSTKQVLRKLPKLILLSFQIYIFGIWIYQMAMLSKVHCFISRFLKKKKNSLYFKINPFTRAFIVRPIPFL